jgi:hypothetical protein
VQTRKLTARMPSERGDWIATRMHPMDSSGMASAEMESRRNRNQKAAGALRALAQPR